MPLKGNGNHFNTMGAGNMYALADYAALPLFMGCFGLDILLRFVPILKDSSMSFYLPGTTDVYIEYEWASDRVNACID